MNFLYFSPHFPDNFQHFCHRLADLGVTVLGIGDCPYDRLSAALRKSLTEYYRIPDMEDYETVVRAVGFFIHKYGKIDRFESLNEHWLYLEAKIRTDFNIPGVRLDEIGNMKFKSKMKKLFQSVGVETAKGRVIDNLQEAKQFGARVGYPIVVKPDSGVGALSTHKVHSAREMEELFSQLRAVPYIFEEFIEGNIFSFDGLTDQDGRIVFLTSHKYGGGIMETVNEDKHIHYHSMKSIPADLEEAGRKIVDAYRLKERFFHLEFFRTDSNRLVALEANLRPPGGYTVDMFNYANDIDIYREWAQVVVHNRFAAAYDRKYICCYIGRKWNANYRHSHEQILKRLGDSIVHHSEISGVFSAALGNYCYIVRSQAMEEIGRAVAIVHETI